MSILEDLINKRAELLDLRNTRETHLQTHINALASYDRDIADLDRAIAALEPAPSVPDAPEVEIPEGFTRHDGSPECPVDPESRVSIVFRVPGAEHMIEKSVATARMLDWTRILGYEPWTPSSAYAASIARIAEESEAARILPSNSSESSNNDALNDEDDAVEEVARTGELIRKPFRVYVETADEGGGTYFDARDEASEYAALMRKSPAVLCVHVQGGADTGEPYTLELWQGNEEPDEVLDAEPPAILRSDLPPDADLTTAPSGDEFATVNGMTHLVVSTEAEAQAIAETRPEEAFGAEHEQEPSGFPGLTRDEPVTPEARMFAAGMIRDGERHQAQSIITRLFGAKQKADA